MKKEQAAIYRCPITLGSLELKVTKEDGDEVMTGEFVNERGDVFPITDGVPDFTWPKTLAEIDEETRRSYDQLAEDYEKYADIPFRTFGVPEHDLRVKMTDLLEVKEGQRILEVGCGDGRGAQYISERLGSSGELFLQELSGAFLAKAADRVSDAPCKVEKATGNACYLSFADNTFDAAHHFGGMNTFSEFRRFLKEMARVVKPGGKVVVGDEGLGEWLRDTEFGRVMMNSNPLLKFIIPFKEFPVEARDLSVEWMCNGAFYVVTFTVGEGEPKGDYHIPIPSARGGTHWSRYYGNLEGVSDEAKKMAHEAREKLGISMHDWLDQIVREQAEKVLKDGGEG